MEKQLTGYGYCGLAMELEWAQALNLKYPVDNEYSAWRSAGKGTVIGGAGGGVIAGWFWGATLATGGIALVGAGVVGTCLGLYRWEQNYKIELTEKVNKIYRKTFKLIVAKSDGWDDIRLDRPWKKFILCAEKYGFFTAGSYDKDSFELNWAEIKKFDYLGSPYSDVALSVLIGLANSPDKERAPQKLYNAIWGVKAKASRQELIDDADRTLRGLADELAG